MIRPPGGCHNSPPGQRMTPPPSGRASEEGPGDHDQCCPRLPLAASPPTHPSAASSSSAAPPTTSSTAARPLDRHHRGQQVGHPPVRGSVALWAACASGGGGLALGVCVLLGGRPDSRCRLLSSLLSSKSTLVANQPWGFQRIAAVATAGHHTLALHELFAQTLPCSAQRPVPSIGGPRCSVSIRICLRSHRSPGVRCNPGVPLL
jgi:hypothetical protein